jgi:tetratricopeptide (TPR) repeat protein
MLFTIRVTILAACGAALFAQERFDMVVRNDFFSGFSGNREALERAMKKSEAVLANNPKQAEAMVWHGSGTFFLSRTAVQNGDLPKAGELYQKGLAEMAAAVALQPDNVAVIIPRAAAVLTASHGVPGERGKQLLQLGLAEYERVYRLQAAYFDRLNGHARGELLFGLAEGYLRMGDEPRARQWFEQLAAVEDPENGHLKQAQAYLESGNLAGTRTCVGCHVAK